MTLKFVGYCRVIADTEGDGGPMVYDDGWESRRPLVQGDETLSELQL